MNVTIIGTGNMAHGIGTRIASGSHSLTIIGRDESEAKELAQKLGSNVKGEALGDSIDGEIVILTLPYAAIPEVVEKHKEQLNGKILVDICNPINFQTFEYLPPESSSGAEEIAKHVPENAKLVKAFNTAFSKTLVAGEVDGKKLDIFIASDDEKAGETVKMLVEDSGMRGLYVGKLQKARALEGIGLIHMSLQEKLGTNWTSALKILP